MMKMKNKMHGIMLGMLIATVVSAQDVPSSINPCCIPEARSDWAVATSKSMTEKAKAQTAEKTVPILFLGDSITQQWLFEATHKWPGGLDSWKKYFTPMGAVNFGISADRIEHLLWRITDGEQLQINPKIIVLLIGTNNLHGNPRCSPIQIAEGIKLTIDTITKKLPSSKILLLGLLPRNMLDTDAKNVKEINLMLAKYADGKQVFFFDAGPSLDKDGKVSIEIFRDGIHLSPEGYELFAQLLLPEISKLQEIKANQ